MSFHEDEVETLVKLFKNIYLFVYLFYVYEYTIAVLMVVSHHVVAGTLNSGPPLS